MTLATDLRASGTLAKSPAHARREGPLPCDALVAVLFLALPLAVFPWFGDPYTSAKWFVLEAIALAWFLSELWWCGRLGWPAFVEERWRTGFVLAVLLLASSLRSGLAGVGPALLDRLCFVLLALAGYWYFRRNRGWTGSMLAATAVSAALTVTVGLAQVIGRRPLPFLSAGDQRSAFFGNVNLTAQFLGVAVILLLAGPPIGPAWRLRARGALATACLVYLYFLSCRSVFLALALALAALVVWGRLSLPSLGRLLGAATAGVLAVLYLGPLLGDGSAVRHPLSRDVLAEKALSTEWRLAVWRSTLALIGDHPLGVGSGRFGDAFIPYQLGLDLIPGERVLFRTPHNEYLRVVAEEGVVFASIVALFLVALFRKAIARHRSGGWHPDVGALLAAGTAFVGVEAVFQFPLATPFGCLTAAVLLGLALASVEPGEAAGAAVARRRRWRMAGTVVAAAALVVLARVVASEVRLIGQRSDAAAQETACRLDPRNLRACVTAAWLHLRSGERLEARRLLVRTLDRSPYYHPAIRLLGEEAASAGDRRRACRYLWIYDQLFRERSVVHGRLDALCGGEPPDLPVGASVPFYGTFPLAESDAAARGGPPAGGAIDLPGPAHPGPARTCHRDGLDAATTPR